MTGAPPETREPQPEKTTPKSEEAETEKTPLPPDQEITETEKMPEVITDDTGEKPEDKSPAEQLADEKPSEDDQSKKP